MIPMNGVKYLVGSEDVLPKAGRAFSDGVCEFLAELSSALMKDRGAAAYPDIVSFAFFCRRANVAAIREKYSDELRFGRGLAFHIAPSNVPINFAFSFVFGLLSGNANIVRVSTKDFPQTVIVCDKINSVIAKYPELSERNAVVSYPADDEISSAYSKSADVRIIWGGDNTVNLFKKMEVKPRCIDIAFSDRYSIGVINGRAVELAEEKEISRLAEAFYNDTYLMDQNACSTPQMIFWTEPSEASKQRFWTAVENYASHRYELQAESAVNKYTQLCRDILNSDRKVHSERKTSLLYRVIPDSLPDDITMCRGTCGYFYEHDISSLDDIDRYVTQKFQTVCAYGIDRQELYDWIVRAELPGVDRIVPFGKSLDIGEIWDGYDIIRFGSRIVSIV